MGKRAAAQEAFKLALSITLLFWLVAWYRERPPRPEAYEVLFQRLQRKLARAGWQRAPAEDSRAFLERVAEDYPHSRQLAAFIELYNRIKYGRQGKTEQSLQQLRDLARAID